MRFSRETKSNSPGLPGVKVGLHRTNLQAIVERQKGVAITPLLSHKKVGVADLLILGKKRRSDQDRRPVFRRKSPTG